MDFYVILEEVEKGQAHNPYAAKINSEWVDGTISIDFLNDNFSQYETAKDMKGATDSEGLKLYFDWLKEKGILP